MIGNIIEQVDIKHLTYDGTLYTGTLADTDIDYSTAVDMNGFGGVVFAITFGDGADTGDVTITLQYSDDNSTFTDAVHDTQNVAFNASDHKIWALDATEPLARYYRLKFVTDDANVVILSVLAIKYNGKNTPITHATGAGQFAQAPVALQHIG